MKALAALTLLIATGSASPGAGQPAAPSTAKPPEGAAPSKKICKWVVAAARGSKPNQLCLSAAAWGARDKLSAADATKEECHYIQIDGSRFESAKVCMTAAEWQNARQADRELTERIQSSTCVAGGGC